MPDPREDWTPADIERVQRERDELRVEVHRSRKEVLLLKAYVSGLEFNQSCQAAHDARRALSAFYSHAEVS